MDSKRVSGRRRAIGSSLMILGALLAWRILWLCSLYWTEDYGEESRDRMVLWFWLSSAAVAAGFGIVFRIRTALWLAAGLAVFALIALFAYPFVFSPPVAPH